MGRPGGLRRGTAAVLLCRLAVSSADDGGEPQWCRDAPQPTANAYNCARRQGTVCPSDAEVAAWGDAAVLAWAGYDMVACTETTAFARPGGQAKIVKRCDGVNECIENENGRCRIEAGGQIICSSDEEGCGGLVDQVQQKTVLDPTRTPITGVGRPTCTGEQPECTGVLALGSTAADCDLAAGCIFTPACSESPTAGCNPALSLGSPIELQVGPSLQSSWKVPYRRLFDSAQAYSYAMCSTYGEIADTEPSIEMRISDVRYTAAPAEELAVFDSFTWPEGIEAVTPERCADFDTCNKLPNNVACCAGEASTCCGSYATEEDDGVTLGFIPPRNFVGTVEFTMTLQSDAASSETASVQRTITATIAVPECMKDEATARSPESFCGEHGVCSGPSGCKCDPHYYGITCASQSEELVAPEFVWRGWTVLFIVAVLANHTEKGQEMFGATLDEMKHAMPPIPEIPSVPGVDSTPAIPLRKASTVPENEPPVSDNMRP